MYIVANNFMLSKIRNIDIFTLTLGYNLKGSVNLQRQGKERGTKEKKIRIKDEFIKRYKTVNNRIISKFGEIGELKFYEDYSLPKKEIHIYKDDEIYEIDVTDEDLNIDIKTYITEIIKTVEGNDDNEKNDKLTKVVYTNLPEDLEIPDMELPKEQYINKLIERRNIINNNGVKQFKK